MTPLRDRRASERGQVMILFVFFFVMIAGIILVSVNVGRMATRHIKLQVAADAGAMAGARVQSLGLEFITVTNDFIGYTFGILLSDLPDPLQWGDLVHRIEQIETMKKLQNKVVQLELLLVPAVVSMTSGTNAPGGVLPMAPYEKVMVPQLKVQRQWWTLFLFSLRESGWYGWKQAPSFSTEIEEKVTAVAFEKSTPMAASDFLGGTKIPPMSAWGSAQPYWVLLGEPGEEMSPIRSILSMMIPGPFWSNRLVETGEIELKGKGEGYASAIVSMAWQFAFDHLQEKAIEGPMAQAMEHWAEQRGEEAAAAQGGMIEDADKADEVMAGEDSDFEEDPDSGDPGALGGES